jgi:hypothetical protein
MIQIPQLAQEKAPQIFGAESLLALETLVGQIFLSCLQELRRLEKLALSWPQGA